MQAALETQIAAVSIDTQADSGKFFELDLHLSRR
jgi:hypothetical protein